MTSEYLFVYGTLKRSFNHPMHAQLVQCAEYVSDATMPGRMYRVAHYPGVIRSDDPAQRVLGELYRVHDAPALFAVLDDYEECSSAHPPPHEYVRERCPVMLPDGHSVTAWVYLYARAVDGLPLIDSGRFG
jgi:gamma-glutamylcyclotransferase (GGCT)/AIG2-like uncharacterized protein YtfP